jgi:hypothetical protein
MHVIPPAFEREPRKHFVLLHSGGSTSGSAPGTGTVYIPIYGWVSASAVGSVTYYNGTGGSNLFTVKTSAGGVSDFCFWEEPSRMLANQPAVLESDSANGVGNFHVVCLVVRNGAGQGGTTQ